MKDVEHTHLFFRKYFLKPQLLLGGWTELKLEVRKNVDVLQYIYEARYSVHYIATAL